MHGSLPIWELQAIITMNDHVPIARRRGVGLSVLLRVAGPGLVVMLADTDAGSVVTAAQSGAQWGYRLLALQFALIPILYVVQELTVRLGTVSRRGHAAMIAEYFGKGWAWTSVLTLGVACIGALLTELSGLAGVGLLYGVPADVTMVLVVGTLIVMALTGSYRSVERIAMAIGAFELAFLGVALVAHPGAGVMLRQTINIPVTNPQYLYLVAANIGAVIMPWMVFFQQSAVVEKGLGPDDLPAARLDTAVGAVITQVIMAAILIAAAAALGTGKADGTGPALNTVQDIAGAITPVLGATWGKLAFALGVSGCAITAAIVVTLTAARTFGEVMGVRHSLNDHPREAPLFYGIFVGVLVVAALVVTSGINLVSLSIGVQVMNALMLPFVLGFLYLLARRLPEPWRLQGLRGGIIAAIILVTTIFAVYAAIVGIWS